MEPVFLDKFDTNVEVFCVNTERLRTSIKGWYDNECFSEN